MSIALTSDGARQICAVLLAGDFCDLNEVYREAGDCKITALTPCDIVSLSRPRLTHLVSVVPAIAEALTRRAVHENRILSERILSLGRRSAHERLAHFLCELCVRSLGTGCADGDGCEIPLTQEQLADTLGLTSVHVNRMLQLLRSQRLIELHRSKLTILDWHRLTTLAGFDPRYLGLGIAGADSSQSVRRSAAARHR